MKNLALALLALVTLVPLARAEDAASPGPLQTYVEAPDDSYGWTKRREGEVGGAKYVELTLTSQTWRDVVWKHQLFILRPKNVDNAKQGLLFIGGGAWQADKEGPVDETNGKLPREATLLAQAAEAIKSPIAVLLQVPHQPILGELYEDQAISYTFDKYLETRDATWPLLLPMVKSAVRAMDAVQEFAAGEWDLKIERFTITGASKRGWTTWLTGATDKRAAAIAPMVIDVLDMPRQMKHQKESYGKLSEQIKDYTDREIPQRMDSPEGQALNAIVDPFAYRSRLTQPKLIILGTNDPYWTLDSLNLYWDELPGDKYCLYVPNKGHGIEDFPRVVGGIVAFHKASVGELELPKLKWVYTNGDGKLKFMLASDKVEQRVMVWTARAESKDFRQAEWTSQEIRDARGRYFHELDIPQPGEGYAAMFVEAVFDGGELPYYLSTNVRIVGSEKAAAE